jgi:hypothetical protein
MTLDDALKIIQHLSVELACTQSIAGSTVRHPRPGDLVFENSTKRLDGIGRLILKRDDFVEFKEPEEDGPKGYYDLTWYIEKLDGSLEFWRNAGFYRILEKSTFWLRDGDPENTEWAKEAIKRHGL